MTQPPEYLGGCGPAHMAELVGNVGTLPCYDICIVRESLTSRLCLDWSGSPFCGTLTMEDITLSESLLLVEHA